MKSCIKYKTGKRHGFNIREDKNGKYHPYKGTMSLLGKPFDRLKHAMEYIKRYVDGDISDNRD